MEELPPALDSTDVLEMVLDKLKVNDLAAAAQVSRHWRAASLAADSAWRAAFEEEFGEAKAVDYPRQRTWRDKFIACLLDNACHKLRSKARYLDELEDSAGMLEKNSQTLLASLNQMDRTLSRRKHDLNGLLASVAGRASTHMESQRGKELLALAAAGGDLARCPRLTPDLCASLRDMLRDVEFWKASIAEERDSLHRMWDSLSYIQTCVKKAKADVSTLQRRKAQLEAATRYRPTVRRC